MPSPCVGHDDVERFPAVEQDERGVDFGQGDDVANAIITQPDGKVIVVGNHNNGKSTDMMIARYNRDGSLDQGFGTGTEPPVVATASSGRLLRALPDTEH